MTEDVVDEDEPPCCELRIYSSLNDFVPLGLRHRTLRRAVARHPSVKDLIEAVGVPHVEIDLIVVNDEPVGFDYTVKAGDRVAAYPQFDLLEMSPEVRLLPPRREEERFVLDVHLGRLARVLRLVGFDTWYRTAADDEELATVSAGEDRTLLTRDVGLLKRSQVIRGYWVRSTQPREQAREVVRRFPPGPPIEPFARCLACNGLLEPAAAADVADQVPCRSREVFTTYSRCPDCGRVYWPGSHFERLTRVVSEILSQSA